MDYEIDIEEHDVLENPAIKTVFPDISVIKKEITQYFEEESNTEDELAIAETLQHKCEDQCNVNAQNTLVKVTVIENETPQHSIQGNKIILGTKAKLTENSKQSNKNLHLGSKLILTSKSDEGIEDDSRVQIFDSKAIIKDENKIKFVLGSKPQIAENNNLKRLDEQNVKLKEIKLVLQDIKSYLNQNGRYCKQCCRLFLSKTALDVHQKKYHQKKIVNRIKNVKRIAKRQYKCSICGICVANNSNLLRHYKNVHSKNVSLKIVKNSSDKTRSNIVNSEVMNEMKTSTKNKTKQSSIQCNICGISLSTYGSLIRHFKNIHEPNTNNVNSKNLEKIRALECDETSAVKIEEHNIIKQNMMTTPDQKINKHTLYVEKRNNVTNGDHANQAKSDAIHENKQRVLKEECSTKETFKVIEEKDTQVDYVDNDSEVRSNGKDVMLKYITPPNKDISSKNSNLCLHCNKEFADQKSLIDHMYEVLEPKRNSSGSIQTAIRKKDSKIFYKCRQCSYYLPSVESYFAHLSRNHKTETFLEVNKKEFDAQCKYCPYNALNVTTYNRHIHSYHIDLMFSRMESEKEIAEIKSSAIDKDIANNDNSFALESVLFECNKCCICFLSSDMAKDHKKHNTDSLINWKCSICNHIFKEQDKDLHKKQHSFSQALKVYNLNENAIRNVLYNCTKCAIHFTEKRYQEHFLTCGSVPSDSAYCSTCDILVDKMEINYHKTKHEHLKDVFDFTIIDSNIIVDTPLKRKGINLEPQVKPKKRYNEQYNSYTYCPTCKSYLSCSGLKNESHLNRNCFRLHTYPCDECGLVFTSSTLEKHKERHEKEKNLKIQDFKFFDLQGIQIRPTIPEYPHCKICKIHFLRKKCISRHICEETVFVTCDSCNIKLSENTYKLHMAFHFYVMYKTSFENGTKISIEQTLKTDVKRKLEILKKPGKHESRTKFQSKIQTESTKIEPDEKLQNKMNTIVLGHKSVDILPNGMEIIEIEDSPTENIIDLVEENNINQIAEDDPLVVLYTCKPCGITVESYDEVINHCHIHYNDKETHVTSVKNCNKCYLKFDSRSISDHERKAHSRVSKIEVLKFDPSCFTSKNMIWVKHIFQNFSEEIVKDLLKNSIYQYEHRIRMECTQKGTLPFYIYKCDSCGNCVDPASVYTHAENPCNTFCKYPCTFCGLRFVTTFTRSVHEKLHKQIKNLSNKSLNIVLFNQSKDKTFNDRIFSTTNQYVLYQCRNCNRVAESLLNDHVCDKNTLMKCITCGLLLSTEDLEAHSSKHKQLGNFCSENFKVILIGYKASNTANSDISPCFSGTVYDYTFYKCETCKMCLKNHENAEKHSCIPNFELDRSICCECELNFPSGNMRHHMKQHKADPHFIKENMNVISFNHKLQQQNNSLSIIKIKKPNKKMVKEKQTETNESRKNENINTDAKKTTNKENAYSDTYTEINGKICYKTVENNDLGCSENNINNVEINNEINVVSVNNDKEDINTIISDNVHEDVEILYKCKCGLHFLDKPKAKEHTKKCHPKELKQNCSKCHLLFNSSELFSHLLVHHKDKTKVHHFKVIEEDT